MKCLHCRSEVVGYGRCAMCGAMMKVTKEMNAKDSSCQKKRGGHTLVSYIIGTILCIVLIGLLMYQTS